MRTITRPVRLALMAVALVSLSACGNLPWDDDKAEASGPPIQAYRCYNLVELRQGESFNLVADANRPPAETTTVSRDYWRDLVAGINGQEDPTQVDLNAVQAGDDGKRTMRIPKPCSLPAERRLGEPPGPGDTPVEGFNPQPETTPTTTRDR